jgi:outer membrane immunogenic protein
MTLRMSLAAGLLLTAAASPAFAQTEAMSWTGPYVGGQIGYAFQPSDGDETINFDTNQDGTFGDVVGPNATTNAFSPGFCGGASTGSTPSSGCRNDRDGVTWAVHAGYDMQFGNIVAGVVGEYGRSTITDNVTAFSTTPAFYTMSRRLKDNAGLRARAGVALGNTLLYGTGGLAWGKIERSFSTSNVPNSFTEADDDDAWGYKVGGGIEQRIAPNFSIGAQYMFTSLKDDDYTVRAGTSPRITGPNPFLRVNAAGTDFQRSHSRFNSHAAQVTASFRF